MRSLKIDTPELCVAAFRSIWDTSKLTKREQAYVIYLNRSCEVIGHEMLSSGGYSCMNYLQPQKKDGKRDMTT